MRPLSRFVWARNAVPALALGVICAFPNLLNGQAIKAWTQRYGRQLDSQDEAYAVAVDQGGEIFVAGSTYDVITRSDMVVVKYSSAGVALWTNLYSGPGHFDDYARALAVAGNGNVIVAGTSRQGQDDYVTIAYSSAGVPLWTNRYDGDAGQDDEVRAMVVDPAGNVIVTGRSGGVGTSWDYLTIAYSVAGAALWTNRYNGPANDFDDANDVAVDALGNVFVTGASMHDPSRDEDYLTIAYSPTGQLLWTNLYNGPGNSSDQPMALAVDYQGNVFVTGSSLGITSRQDYATIAYSSGGVPLWTNRFNGVADYFDYAKAVAVDTNGNVFVTGSSAGVDVGDVDYVTIAYSSSTGAALWTNHYDGPAHSEDEAIGMAASDSGQVFVTGYSAATNLFGFPSDHDYATVAYNVNGLPLWTNRYSGAANGFDAPRSKSAIAVDAEGSTIVTGSALEYSSTLGTEVEFVTVKYTPVELRIQVVGNQVVLSWPVVGFGLESAPVVMGQFTNIAGAISPFTNPVVGAQRYFRLKGN